MAHVMQVEVVDSERLIFSGKAQYLVAPAFEGEMGIFPYHIPLISKLKPGILRLELTDDQPQLILAISGGFLEVQGNKVKVLADVVERTEELDEARLTRQKAEAETRVKKVDSSLTYDVANAEAALDIAIAQLKALDYIKRQAKR